MKFMTKASQPNLGIELQEELTRAAKVDIAVAYFSPDDKTLSALKNLSKLRLVISDDWQISNPRKIEKLKEADKVRRIISGDGGGKLHSKVYLIQRLDGSRWAMIGSANLTHQGLFSNQEAVITLDSNVPGDGLQIAEAERWFLEVWRDGKDQIDFEMAKTIFDTRSKYRMSFVEKTVIEKSHGQKSGSLLGIKNNKRSNGRGPLAKILGRKRLSLLVGRILRGIRQK